MTHKTTQLASQANAKMHMHSSTQLQLQNNTYAHINTQHLQLLCSCPSNIHAHPTYIGSASMQSETLWWDWLA